MIVLNININLFCLNSLYLKISVNTVTYQIRTGLLSESGSLSRFTANFT